MNLSLQSTAEASRTIRWHLDRIEYRLESDGGDHAAVRWHLERIGRHLDRLDEDIEQAAIRAANDRPLPPNPYEGLW